MNIKKIFILLLIIKFFNLSVFGESQFKNKENNFHKKNSNKNEFTPTTSFSGNTYFTFGTVRSNGKNDYYQITYENKFKLNTSFNGSDKLLAIFESGNALHSPLNLDLQSRKGDTINISTLLYEFKMSDEINGVIGPKMFGYNGLAGKSTAYNERIAILDGSNFTTTSGIGPGLGIAKRNKNGSNASIKIGSNNSKINNQSLHLISQIGLTKKIFGGTITSNINEDFNAFGLATYVKPRNLPSISFSIEQKEDNESKKIHNWIIGLQKNLDSYNLGMALGTYNTKENIAYENWIEIFISDKLKIIPVLFIKNNNHDKDELGIALNTKFSY